MLRNLEHAFAKAGPEGGGLSSRARTSRSNIAGPTSQTDRLPALADDLVRRPVAVIVADQHVCRARGQGRDHDDSDRVRDRRRSGRRRPGREPQPAGRQRHRRELPRPPTLGAKRLELLRELVPQATTIAALRAIRTIPRPMRSEATLPAAAQAMGLQLLILDVGSASDIDAAIATVVQSGAARCSSAAARS